MSKTPNIVLRLAPDTRQRIERAIAGTPLTLSDFIRAAIVLELAAHEAVPVAPSRCDPPCPDCDGFGGFADGDVGFKPCGNCNATGIAPQSSHEAVPNGDASG